MNIKENKTLIVVVGPTASGKTKLAIEMARQLDGEIISADSRQVYKGMNIGTGKDYDEYLSYFKPDISNPSGIEKIHLIDILEAGENYNVAFFQRDFKKAYESILARNKTPILCGGTGMYIEAVLNNYQETQVPVNELFREELNQFSDEVLYNIFYQKYKCFYENADISTRKRLIRAIEIADFKCKKLPINERSFIPDSYRQGGRDTVIFGINISVELRRERITKRLYERLENGMIAEVKGLLAKGILAEKLIFYGLEYKFITEYLLGHLTYDEMVKKLETAIHQFAKRQMTFFRSMERKGFIINWLDGSQKVQKMAEQALFYLENNK